MNKCWRWSHLLIIQHEPARSAFLLVFFWYVLTSDRLPDGSLFGTATDVDYSDHAGPQRLSFAIN